jgi:hypothetical protein
MLSLRECEEASQLDELDESTHFTFLNAFFIRNNTHENDARTGGPSTLGVSDKR